MRVRILAMTLAFTALPRLAAAQDAPVSQAFRDQAASASKHLQAAAELMPEAKYSFKPTPAQMSYGDIVAHLEGKKLLAEHVNLEAGHPPGEMAVRIVEVDLTAAVREVLNKMTLADLAEKVSQRGQMYYI